MTTMTPAIRWMIRRDMPAVLEIDRQAYGPLSWSEDEFVRCLRQRNRIGYVATSDDQKIVAFYIVELHREHVVVLRMAVSPSCARHGIGRAIMAGLADNHRQRGRTAILAQVSEYADGVMLFLRACGFRAVSVVRDRQEYVFRLEWK